MSKLKLLQFSDVLCVWAYVSQIRVDQLLASEGDQVEVEPRFNSVFANARDRLADKWADRGGLAGYAEHVREVCEPFDHVTVHDRTWAEVAPRSSLGAHLFLSAIRRLARDGDLPAESFRRTCWAFREAFFAEARDIGLRAVQYEIAEQLELPIDAIEGCLATSAAHAELAADLDLVKKHDAQVSPTLILNDGRQRLAGNVGYRVIAANVRELLRTRGVDDASWC